LWAKPGHWSPVTGHRSRTGLSAGFLQPPALHNRPLITSKDRKYLRGLAHALSPVVIVGQRGLTDSVVRQVDQALTDHELIKVRIGGESPTDRDEAATALGERTGCGVAGIIGRVLILYRAHPEHPRIALPTGVGSATTNT
jgi:RNA-binding protein